MRLLLFLCLLLVPLAAHAQELTVFAAASLTDAMNDISAQWVKAGHKPLRLSYGSSSTLARQIEQGAPANLFASADEKWMDYLVQKNLIVPNTRKDLLGNDLVLVVPAGKPVHVTIGPGFDLAGLLGPSGRLAVGDPAHVPVGIYAQQALRKLGLWDSISPGWPGPTMSGPGFCWWNAVKRPPASSMGPMPRCRKASWWRVSSRPAATMRSLIRSRWSKRATRRMRMR